MGHKHGSKRVFAFQFMALILFKDFVCFFYQIVRVDQNRPKLSHNLKLQIKKWNRRCCHTPMSSCQAEKNHTRVEVRVNLL